METQISAVTVYTSQALITRQGSIQLRGDESELMVTELPITLQPDSVRVTGSGTTAVQLLGVRSERITSLEAVAPKVAQLEAQIKTLEAQKRDCTDQLAAVQLKHKQVQALSQQSVPQLSKRLVKQQLSLDDTKALLEFLGQQYEDYGHAIAQLENQQQTLDQQITVLKQRLKQIRNARPNQSYTLRIVIAPEAAGEFQLEITYLVSQASWQPLYDLNVSIRQERLHLSYLAEVKQTTGEDWLGVALTLSTAKPGLGSLPPKLQPWYINLPPAAPVQGIRRRSKRSPAAAEPAAAALSADEMVFEAQELRPVAEADALDAVEANQVRAEAAIADVSKTGSVVTFQVGGGSDVPSDGNPHKATLFNDDYPAQLQYVALPRLVSFAYLQATVTNPADGVTLLPGKANIFRDRTFVGATQLGHVAPGQAAQLNLGIDQGLGIERDLVERQVDKKLIGNQRRITVAYRLMITNFLDQPTTVKLTEQLPVSRNEKLKVRLTQVQPKIDLREMGALTWDLNLRPQAQQQIDYQFVVEHPPDQTVIGF